MTFLLCDPGWYVHKSDAQNKWDDNKHTQNTRLKTISYAQVDTYTTDSSKTVAEQLNSSSNEESNLRKLLIIYMVAPRYLSYLPRLHDNEWKNLKFKSFLQRNGVDNLVGKLILTDRN